MAQQLYASVQANREAVQARIEERSLMSMRSDLSSPTEYISAAEPRAGDLFAFVRFQQRKSLQAAVCR